ncbi:MAG: ShlB/FhaC/HecB family hemolysin secretion/activation protein [Veillonellales bacterium]
MKKQVIAAMLVLCLNAPVCQGEEVSTATGEAVQKRTPQNTDYYRLEQNLKERRTEQEPIQDNTGKPGEMAQQDKSITVFVRKIVTTPSQILTADEIESVVSQYEGKTISMKELNDAVKKLNALYRQKQYITAQALLPSQKIENGIVNIQLVEGHVGQIYVENNRHTNLNYIKDRLTLQPGNLLKLNELEKDLTFFNRTNDIQLQAELRPGKEFGATDLIVKTQEPVNSQATLFSDNGGRKESGLYRTGLTWVDSSLTGWRDTLSVTAIQAKDTTAGAFSYYMPVDTQGTRVGVSYDKNQTSVSSGAYESLDIKGNSDDFAVYLSHPFRVTPQYKSEGYLEWHNKTSDTSFSGITLLNNKVKTGVAGASFQSIGNNRFWYMRNDFTFGNSDSRVHDFFRYNLSYVQQRWLSHGNLLIFRANGQWANKELLPSSEQFSLGGMSSVRGFPEGLKNGDKGYCVSAELDMPVRPDSKTKFMTFIDHGGTFTLKGNGEGVDHNDFLTSVGCGVILNFSKYESGKIAIGFPLSSQTAYRQHVRVHFFLQSTIF